MRLPFPAIAAAMAMLAGCSSVKDGRDGVDSASDAAVPAAAPAGSPADETPVSPPPRTRTAAPPPATRSMPAPTRVALAAGAPENYVVRRGDTLWDISARFLDEPWRWPEIWYANEQIENPHLIFPGDRISLVYVDGVPQLRVERGAVQAMITRDENATRLSPEARVQSLDEAITTIPYESIGPFLSRPSVLSRSDVNRAPYVLRLKGEHLIGGEGIDAYVRGDGLITGATFTLMHLGDRYLDPENGRVIGQEALYVGEARVVREGDPATVKLVATSREVLEGDVLIPVDPDVPLNFQPSAPAERIDGSIVEVVDGISLIGQYQIVVLNRGKDSGLAQGHVLEVFQRGERVRDRSRSGPFASVRLPEEYAGRVLVFRVLDEISYALVMSATSEMRVADLVRTPGLLSSEEEKARAQMARNGR